MEKALVRLGLIGISSNSSLVVPGIFTVIDRMSKLFKELMGRTGLRGLRRAGFGSNNQDSLRKQQARSMDLFSCHWMDMDCYKPLWSQITQKPGEEPAGQVPVHQTCCPFLGINRGWSKEGPKAEHGLWSLKCVGLWPDSPLGISDQFQVIVPPPLQERCRY